MLPGARMFFESQSQALKPLPSGAVRVKYLQQTGSQYIDTGIRQSADLKLYVTYQFYAASTSWDNTDIFGCRANDHSQGNLLGRCVDKRNDLWNPFFSQANNDWENCKVTVDSSVMVSASLYWGGTTVNGVKYPIASSVKPLYDLPIYLFSANTNGTHSRRYAKVRIGSFAIVKSGKPVLDMVPVSVGGVGYMFDRVSGVLFGNKGGGSFGVGPEGATLFNGGGGISINA